MIIDLSSRRLASTRSEWGLAMAAELSYIEGRSSRLRFALGCARVALVPPLADARPALAARLVATSTVAAVIGLAALVQRRAAAAPQSGARGAAYELAATLFILSATAFHLLLVMRRARDVSKGARAGRRWGVIGGGAMGALALSSLPVPGLPPWVIRVPNIAVSLGIAIGCMLMGAMAARASGESASGREAGMWAGRVAGSIMAIGLLAATLWATAWFVNDPATISQYRDSLSTAHYSGYHTHFRTIAGFALSENLDTALGISLLAFPLFGLLFGALGGLIGLARQGSSLSDA